MHRRDYNPRNWMILIFIQLDTLALIAFQCKANTLASPLPTPTPTSVGFSCKELHSRVGSLSIYQLALCINHRDLGIQTVPPAKILPSSPLQSTTNNEARLKITILSHLVSKSHNLLSKNSSKHIMHLKYSPFETEFRRYITVVGNHKYWRV